MDLMDLLQGQLSKGMIDQLSQQIGGADRQKTAAATTGILSTLMGGLAKNAATPDGASSLANALDRDHDGSILDDVMGMLSGQVQPASQKALNGSGILNHILGPRQSGAIDMISNMSGLDKNKTGSLMTMLAPVIMGALAKAKQQEGLDAGGLASLLSGTVSNRAQADPTMSLVTRFLDSDGDGDISDDVARLGMKFLGNLFKKRR
jgi:hypothetical protein